MKAKNMHKRSGEEKTKSDEIQVIFNGIADLLFVMDKNRMIIKVNKATCDAFKKKPEELIGKYCYEIVHGTDVLGLIAQLRRLLKQNRQPPRK
jgi:PAS domain S-box-containing protein